MTPKPDDYVLCSNTDSPMDPPNVKVECFFCQAQLYCRPHNLKRGEKICFKCMQEMQSKSKKPATMAITEEDAKEHLFHLLKSQGQIAVGIAS